MTVIQKVVHKVNPGQIPIIIGDLRQFTLHLNKYNGNFQIILGKIRSLL